MVEVEGGSYAVDVEDDMLIWSTRKSKAIKQPSETNLMGFVQNFLPTRKEVYIKGFDEEVEVVYSDYISF